MRILGHLHTLNDDDVIDRSLGALLAQTLPVNEVLLVDNGSTDGTLKRSFPGKVKVIRHSENLGTSGAVITGFQYAIEQGYDWIWILDGDSAPRKDALEVLVAFYQSLSPPVQDEAWMLGSLPVDVTMRTAFHGLILTPRGPVRVRPPAGEASYRCDVTCWSGSLYKLTAVRRVGMPQADYVLNHGEFEYGYRGKQFGYTSFVHQNSIVDHNIGGPPLAYQTRRLGPLRYMTVRLPPIRYYYDIRNYIYFYTYEYKNPKISAYLVPLRNYWPWFLGGLLLSRENRWVELRACFRGFWDGLCKNMHHRY